MQMTKEQEILSAASEEFFEKGYDGTSTAVIAQKAGVTHAMVNYYFRTKEQLFLRILDSAVYDFVQGGFPPDHPECRFGNLRLHGQTSEAAFHDHGPCAQPSRTS